MAEGAIHHVTGDLVIGMQYNKRKGRRPEETMTFHTKELIGTIAAEKYPDCDGYHA